MDLDKIIEEIKSRGITAYKIAESTNLTEVGINKILSGKSKNPRKSTIKELSDFLWPTEQLGKKSDALMNTNGNKFIELPSGKFLMSVKLVPIKAYAQYISECCEGEYFSEHQYEEVSFHVDQYARGNYMAFEIKGDSMDNGSLYDTPDKATALCRELGRQHWKDGFRDSLYGWIIVHKDTILCKDITNQDLEKGIITCHSRNTSPEYPDFDIHLNDVKQIFKIIKRTF